MFEPIYIVIHKGSQSQNRLASWARSHSDPKHVDKNRLYIYEQKILDKFRLTWTQDWNHIMIWDCWAKKHIHFD